MSGAIRTLTCTFASAECERAVSIRPTAIITFQIEKRDVARLDIDRILHSERLGLDLRLRPIAGSVDRQRADLGFLLSRLGRRGPFIGFPHPGIHTSPAFRKTKAIGFAEDGVTRERRSGFMVQFGRNRRQRFALVIEFHENFHSRLRPIRNNLRCGHRTIPLPAMFRSSATRQRHSRTWRIANALTRSRLQRCIGND